MRYIRTKTVPKAVNLADLEAAKRDFAKITDPKKRAAFIKKNASTWSAISEALWGLGGFKCWYSEAVVQKGLAHVEHYRPKGKVAGVKHTGYWWRAFDWTNFRIAHPIANVRIKDYLTGKLSGKGTYFPLKPGSPRANNEAQEASEIPVLLDPTVAADCRLLSFDLTSGRPIPAIAKKTDPWLHERARLSIEFYYLYEADWNIRRKDLVDDVNALCDHVEELADDLPKSQIEYDKALDDLTDYLDYTSEFSAVANQVVMERGLLETLFPKGSDSE